MEVFWEPIVRHIFDLLSPKTIVEIGAEEGKNTQHVLEYCKYHNGLLHSIDPELKDPVAQMEKDYAPFFRFHKGLSLNVLPQLDSYDVVLIDGDHNWYTVYHELLIIERYAQTHGTFPMILLHDVEWPYGKRNMYANIDLIPDQYRQQHTVGGIRIDEGTPMPDRGLNMECDHAIYEHGIRNGVRSAVEDFLQHTRWDLTDITIVGFHGLGILCDSKILNTNPALKNFLEQLHCSKEVQQTTRAVEADRITKMIYNNEICKMYTNTSTKLENEQRARLTQAEAHQVEMQRTAQLNREQREQQERVWQNKLEQEHQAAQRQQQLWEEKQQRWAQAQEEWAQERIKIHKDFSHMQKEHIKAQQHMRQQIQQQERLTENYKEQLQAERHQYQETLAEEHQKHEHIIKTWGERNAELQKTNTLLHHNIQHILTSRSWRYTHVLRVIEGGVKWSFSKKPLYWFCGNLKDIWTDFGQPLPGLVHFVRHTLLGHWLPASTPVTIQPIEGDAKFFGTKHVSPLTTLTQQELTRSKETVKKMPSLPSIHIFLLVPLLDEIKLRRTLNSIVEQTYPFWNITVVDTSQSSTIIQGIVQDYSIYYPNKLHYSKQNDTQDPRIEAQETTHGTYSAFLNAGDTLQENALERLCTAVNEEAQPPDLVYSDHDELNAINALAYTPRFKPEWSPELLLAYNYIGRFFLVKRTMLAQSMHPVEQKKGDEDLIYDLLLRIAEQDPSVSHVHHVLWHHDRIFPLTDHCIKSHWLALEKAMWRRNLKYTVTHSPHAQAHKELFFSLTPNLTPQEEPTVTIIIPTKDRGDMLKACIDSITEKTDYQHYKILIIDNGSTEKTTKNYLQSTPHTVIRIETDEFNFAALNNKAVQHTDSELVLFLNNDTEMLHASWLHAMVGTLLLDTHIGAVGAKLLYPPKGFPYRVQSAGAILGRHWASLVKFKTEEELGYGFYNHVIRNCAIVSGACMLTKRDLFMRVGGFDEEKFGVDFNDVDYCLKLLQEGERIVWTPHAQILHHLSASRGDNNGLGASVNPKEAKAFEQKWGWLFGHDPYYNNNFSLDINEDAFTLRTQQSSHENPLL